MTQNISRSSSQMISASRAFYEKAYGKHPKNLSQRTLGDSCTLGDSVSTAADLRKRTSPVQSALQSTYKITNSLFESTQKDTLTTARTIRTVLSKNSNEIMNDNTEDTVEKLLEDGYMVVTAKSDMKEVLKADNEKLEMEIARVKKDIEPELRRTKVLQETLKECQGIQAKYVEEIEMIEGEILKVKRFIDGRKQENRKKEEQMRSVINRREYEINGLKQEKIVNEDFDKKNMTELAQAVREVKEEEYTLTGQLNSLKRQLEQVKAIQSRKQKVVEEKSMMFVGMLQLK